MVQSVYEEFSFFSWATFRWNRFRNLLSKETLLGRKCFIMAVEVGIVVTFIYVPPQPVMVLDVICDLIKGLLLFLQVQLYLSLLKKLCRVVQQLLLLLTSLRWQVLYQWSVRTHVHSGRLRLYRSRTIDLRTRFNGHWNHFRNRKQELVSVVSIRTIMLWVGHPTLWTLELLQVKFIPISTLIWFVRL